MIVTKKEADKIVTILKLMGIDHNNYRISESECQVCQYFKPKCIRKCRHNDPYRRFNQDNSLCVNFKFKEKK